MEINRGLTLIQHPSPGFICEPDGRSRESERFTARLTHELRPPASPADLAHLRQLIPVGAEQLLAFYARHDGFVLYRDALSKTTGVELFRVADMEQQTGGLRQWLDMLDDEDDTSQLKTSIAIGEFPRQSGGNYFAYFAMPVEGPQTGKVFFLSYDDWREEPFADSFDQFLSVVSTSPATLLSEIMGCTARYSDQASEGNADFPVSRRIQEALTKLAEGSGEWKHFSVTYNDLHGFHGGLTLFIDGTGKVTQHAVNQEIGEKKEEVSKSDLQHLVDLLRKHRAWEQRDVDEGPVLPDVSTARLTITYADDSVTIWEWYIGKRLLEIREAMKKMAWKSVHRGNEMNLPQDIETQIVDYLHLEFGEDTDDSNSLKESDLRYEGEFLFGGFPTHFWWFPCVREQCWVTVEPIGASYCIGMTTNPPGHQV